VPGWVSWRRRQGAARHLAIAVGWRYPWRWLKRLMCQKSSSRQARFTLVESCNECFGPGDGTGVLNFGARKDIVKRGLNWRCVGKEMPIEI
jgi:hypothetical protein